MLTASPTDGPAFHTRSHTHNTPSSTTSTPHPDTAPQISQEPTTAPKPLTVECLEALLQMQKTAPFCKHICKRLLNGKAPNHEFDTFNHVKGLIYKHITDTGKKFLALVIPKSWKYKVLMEAHDKLGHQGNSSNANTIGKGCTRILGNILQTVFFADGKKLKFNNTHYR